MLDAVEHGRQPAPSTAEPAGPAPRCGTPIVSRGQGDANRTTYWCPHCQAASSGS